MGLKVGGSVGADVDAEVGEELTPKPVKLVTSNPLPLLVKMPNCIGSLRVLSKFTG